MKKIIYTVALLAGVLTYAQEATGAQETVTHDGGAVQMTLVQSNTTSGPGGISTLGSGLNATSTPRKTLNYHMNPDPTYPVLMELKDATGRVAISFLIEE